MADFDAILRKALASRPDAPGEERRKIYERARQALVRQLTSFEPPLPPEDISRQRLALEAAIREVEADAAARDQFTPGETDAGPRAPTASPPLASAPVSSAPVPSAPVVSAPVPPSARPAPPPVRPAEPARPVPPLDTATPSSPAADAPAPVLAASPLPKPADADEPWPASPSPIPGAETRVEPGQAPASETPTFAAPPAAPTAAPSAGSPSDRQPAAAATKGQAKKGGSAGFFLGLLLLLVVVGGGIAAWQLGFLDPYLNTDQPQTADVDAQAPLEPAPEVRTVGSDPTRSSERLLPDNQGAVDEPLTLPTTDPAADATDDMAAEPAADPANDPAASDGTDVAALEPETPALPVAQTAILYEEGLTPDADGFTAPGRAVWRLEDEGGAPVIVGSVEIPARGIALSMRISENQDEALPATHLLEFTFSLSEAFPANAISELVGVVVKPQEQAGGDPLRGAIVDLGEGVFWQALAAGEADQAVNVSLIREGGWFDLPILYDDNRRAIITFEKGADGEAVFQQALNAWSN